VRRGGETVVVRLLPGEIVNNLNAERVEELLSAIGGVSHVVVNLSDLRSMPAFLLGRLVRLHRGLAAAGGRLKLCGLQPEILDVFTITHMVGVLDICDDEARALASF
jgi:anti-anti-sigma factor